jgi:uncharacterized protein YjiS (DUF1127 family)
MHGKRTIDARGIQAFPSLESQAKLERALANGRALRARAVAEIVITVASVLDPLLRALGARFGRRRRQRRTYHALMRCGDRVLADIGIAREDVPLMAKGIDLREYDVNNSGWGRRRHEMRRRLDAARRARRERRRIDRELMAYLTLLLELLDDASIVLAILHPLKQLQHQEVVPGAPAERDHAADTACRQPRAAAPQKQLA